MHNSRNYTVFVGTALWIEIPSGKANDKFSKQVLLATSSISVSVYMCLKLGFTGLFNLHQRLSSVTPGWICGLVPQLRQRPRLGSFCPMCENQISHSKFCTAHLIQPRLVLPQGLGEWAFL